MLLNHVDFGILKKEWWNFKKKSFDISAYTVTKNVD